MRLSEAIRKGIPITPEGRTFCGCALGAAWNAEMGYILNGSNLWDLLKNHKNKDFPYDEIFVAFSEKTGWDMGLMENISKKHFVGEMSREQCADYAEQWEREHGLQHRWIRTDYQFESVKEAETMTRFFFGDELADRIVAEQLSILPECTGIWWTTF